MPEVTSISPTFVANPGTDSFGMYGSGFTGATQVWIGDHPAVSFSVQSDTEIWAVTHHEYSKGSDVPVFVESPGGRSTNAGQAGSLTLGQPDS